MNTTLHSHSPSLLGGVAAALLLCTTGAPAQDDFAALKARLKNGIEQQPEAEVIKLLELGLGEYQPAQAAAVTESWLKQNLPQNPKLLYLLARNAEMSGNWREASAAYQQFLANGDVKSAEAADSITAIHSLLIKQLDDVDAAYSFSRRMTRELAVNPRFRQYDRWFLEEAKRRNDLQAVTDRLLALANSGASRDHLQVFHQDDLLWLIDAVHAVRLDQRPSRVTEELVASARELAKSNAFDEELRLVLVWKAASTRYNLDRIENKEVQAPLEDAKRLLANYPRYASAVQTDWAGGSNSRHYRDDPKKYWPHQLEGKLPPIQEAITKLDEVRKLQALNTWTHRYYDGGPDVLSAEDTRNLVLNSPQLINHRLGPKLAFGYRWDQLKLEEAKALSPHLERNPSPEAAMIRTIALAGEGKDYDRMMDHLIKHESWRLNERELNHVYPDQLWQWAGKPGGNGKRDQAIKRFSELKKRLLSEKAIQELPANKRLQEFRKHWQDLRSPAPKLPGVASMVYRYAKATPQAVEDILKDDSVEARLLASRLMNEQLSDGKAPLFDYRQGRISSRRYSPYIWQWAERERGLKNLQTQEKFKNLYKPHPLLPALNAALARQLKAKQVEAWLVMTWINTQFPEQLEEAAILAGQVVQSPSWKQLPVRVRNAMQKRFPAVVLSQDQQQLAAAAKTATACMALRELTAESTAAQAIEALNTTRDKLLNAPQHINISSMHPLAELSDEVWAEQAFRDALAEFIETVRPQRVDENNNYGNRLQAIADKGDPDFILQTAAYLWLHVERHHRTLPNVKKLANQLTDKHPEAASALARMGLQVIARHSGGHTWFKRDEDIPLFKSIRGKTALKMGLVEIPVAPDHPHYPVHLAQAEWMTENRDSAWKLVDANWEVLQAIQREMSLPFLMWVLDRSIQNRNSDRQEQLIKSLLAWVTEPTSSLRASEKGAIEIAYGDIAVQRGQLREAAEIFSRISNSEAYQDLPVRHEAALRRVRVDRLAKNYDGALQLLTELEMDRIPGLWTEIRFARAQVHFDMEEFDDCQDDINTILAREPNHPDAKILLGKVHLRKQKLMEATEVEIGSATSQQKLVPGERLKVTLTDPTLAVSGAGTEIEVVVWAESGDREQFFLRQFGDQKTKFRGEVATSLGAPSPDDGTLQVIGDDQVFYAYAERFLAKMNGLEEKRGGPIGIASDATLMASARKLLSESEQRRADMQEVMQEISESRRRKPTNVEGAAKAQLATEAIRASMEEPGVDPSLRSAERNIAQIAKPGNPIHVRVVDPDRSRTAEIDELTVSVSSSSGDTINRVVLKETETHSGWFEASIRTTGASARAMARDSEPGRNPNMVISSNPEYPAWRPVASKGRIPEFTIDLNDRVELGELTLNAAEEGFKLRNFVVQTAPRHGAWTTVGIHPRQAVLSDNPWRPSVTVVSESGRNHHYGARDVTELADLRTLMLHGWMEKPEMAIGMNVTGPTTAFPTAVVKDVKWLRSGRWENPAVVYRFQAHFHEAERVDRHIRFDLGAHNPAKSGIKGDAKQFGTKPQFLMLVDGRPVGEVSDRVLSGVVSLSPGVHTLEVWATGWLSNIGFGRQPKLQMRSDEELPWEDFGEEKFDPRTFPEGSYDHRNRPAEITAVDEGKAFKIKFARGSETRLVRFLFTGNEGPVPALNKIALTDEEGGQVLPLEEDFAELNKNQILEILTGDRIFVRYLDDRFVTPAKERQERFLNVSFTDAKIEFADMEPRFNEGKNQMEEYYERLLRFRHGKPLDLAIRDADMDVSVEPDSIPVTLSSGGGKPVTMSAVETGDSTGIFQLRITPVTAKPSKENHLQVAEGGTITATYLDEENNRPGVPTERVVSIDHAKFVEPQLVLGDSRVEPWVPEEGQGYLRTLIHGFAARMDLEKTANSRTPNERIRPRWEIQHHLKPADQYTDDECQAVLGQHLYIEVHAPQYALGVQSKIKVFAQTETGRRNSPKTGKAFDTSVRGTVQIDAGLIPVDLRYRNGWNHTPTIASYRNVSPWSGNVWDRTYDRFYLVVPLIAGVLPEHGVLTREQMEDMARLSSDSRSAKEIYANSRSLVARPGEKIHIGFQYTDREGKTRWSTATARTITHPAFDIMSEDYHDPVTTAYAGEDLHLRVVDLGADVSDEIDTTTVLMQAKSGAKYPVLLRESGPHTGIFRQNVKLSYTADASKLPEQLDVVREGFPVTYGDTVAARYTDANEVDTEVLQVTISKGADGLVSPFSKKYEDEEIAMRTQFSLAEAYLEMAKRHRLLGQTEQADLEYNSAKLLLSKAMDQFSEADTRAHAEYLLGTLTMEEADTATDPEIKETRFRAALSRFMNVTGTYPESLHASRAQYRIATVYEKLGEPEIAAQEYVKLAYKYPDSEYLATSMAKLGSHFLKKAAAYEAQAKPLLARAEEDADAAYEGQALQKMAEREYVKTASIFGRLQERFPDNRLAGKSGLHAGQALMRAKKWREAISMFQRVFNEETYDGPEERAPAIFWSAMCYQEIRQEMAAYSAYKRLTYDFPESKWAGYARAKLSEERLLKLEEKIEIERLEAAGQQ